MTDLPEFVYLVTVDGTWPVSAVADCHPSTPRVVADLVEKRIEGKDPDARRRVHVWKARLTDVREVDLVPAQTIGPELRERDVRERP